MYIVDTDVMIRSIVKISFTLKLSHINKRWKKILTLTNHIGGSYCYIGCIKYSTGSYIVTLSLTNCNGLTPHNWLKQSFRSIPILLDVSVTTYVTGLYKIKSRSCLLCFPFILFFFTVTEHVFMPRPRTVPPTSTPEVSTSLTPATSNKDNACSLEAPDTEVCVRDHVVVQHRGVSWHI